MIGDVLTVAWKEWRETVIYGGGRGKWYPLLFLAIFGVMLPLQSGALWLNTPVSLVNLGWVPFLLGSGWAADSFAGERERHTLETLLASRLSDGAILLGKMAAVVSYCWGLTLLTLPVSIIVANIAQRNGQFQWIAPEVFAADVIVSFLMSVLSVALGVLVSLHAPTVRQAAQKMSLGFFAIIWCGLLFFNLAPRAWRDAAGQAVNTAVAQGTFEQALMQIATAVILILVAADVILVALAWKRFRRVRLLLD